VLENERGKPRDVLGHAGPNGEFCTLTSTFNYLQALRTGQRTPRNEISSGHPRSIFSNIGARQSLNVQSSPNGPAWPRMTSSAPFSRTATRTMTTSGSSRRPNSGFRRAEVPAGGGEDGLFGILHLFPGDHFKTGHRGSLQNRRTNHAAPSGSCV
jgi:hypothetical protein